MPAKSRTADRISSAGQGAAAPVNLPLESSVGYQVRLTHRSIQRLLQSRIEPHGVQLGMWYLLRVLWTEDGLTQRELSHRVEIMEPTTLQTIAAMERSGLIKRVRNAADRRKMNVFLTKKGRQLEGILLPVAADVVKEVVRGFSDGEVQQFLGFLRAIQKNLGTQLDPSEPAADGFADAGPAARAALTERHLAAGQTFKPNV
jgi:MarR family transcriptional regulator, organic hydroperoxide resistance regulator